jgi:hypothetical protein
VHGIGLAAEVVSDVDGRLAFGDTNQGRKSLTGAGMEAVDGTVKEVF